MLRSKITDSKLKVCLEDFGHLSSVRRFLNIKKLSTNKAGSFLIQ